MSADQEILKNIVNWVNGEEPIRSLVLVGSRAQHKNPDDLADIDVQVYAQTNDPYLLDDSWLARIGTVWVCVSDEYYLGAIRIPTRLVIFEGGVKVDFAFYPARVINKVLETEQAFRILVDKDGAATAFRPKERSTERLDKPDQAAFTRVVEEFWFEAYHVAKYLARNELWLVKSRDWATKQFLLRMIEWHAKVKYGWEIDTFYAGKNLHSWVDATVREELHHIFAHFDAVDSWNALIETTRLFRQLAKETAGALGFIYPDAVDRNISMFIADLKGRGDVS